MRRRETPAASPELPFLLFVDPHPEIAFGLQASIVGRAVSRVCCDFVTARHLMTDCAPDLLITNGRLEMYNGLHLAYLAKAIGLPTRCVVYSDRHDPALAREVRAAGAFFELQSGVVRVIAAYLTAVLPAIDRRSPSHDRRQRPRGGRRPLDHPCPAL